MKKYKYIADYGECEAGKTYDENFTWGTKVWTVNQLIEIHPENFELIDDFILPERWHIVITEENQRIVSEWIITGCIIDIGCICGMCNPDKKGWNRPQFIKEDGYDFGSEITFSQFKQYVLKESVGELIGYRVVKNFPSKDSRFVIGFFLNSTKFGENGWGEWAEVAQKNPEFFEPVYAPTKNLPEICGYKGTAGVDTVNYGCKTVSLSTIQELYSLGVTSIEIDDYTIERSQLEQIINYFE